MAHGGQAHYRVPYSSGFNVLGYNTEVFGDTPPDSWSVVFEETTLPDGESNAGRVQAYDGPIYIADAALYLSAAADLAQGSLPPDTRGGRNVRGALNLLRQQRELVGRYWRDAFIQIDDFTSEGVAASSTWPFQTNILHRQAAVHRQGRPRGGGYRMGRHHDAEATLHPNCAYMWMEWSLNPKLQGDLAAWFGAVPAVAKPPATGTSCSAPMDAPTAGASPSTRSCSGRPRPTTATAQRNQVPVFLPRVGDRLPGCDRRTLIMPCGER